MKAESAPSIDDLAVSTIEELDPEPPARGVPPRVTEFALGVVLLLGVLGWGGWQWWRYQGLQERYHLAQQAAERQDWDEARVHYLAAAEYRDAQARAGEAARMIADRDKHYAAAAEHMKKGELTASLQALEVVHRIQPYYQDVPALRSIVRDLVHRAALSDTIAMRTGADRLGPPGLYWHATGRWLHLDRSDSSSKILGAAPQAEPERGSGDLVIYDVPTASWRPHDTSPDLGDRLAGYYPTPGSPELEGRALVAASRVGDRLIFTRLALDPASYNFYIAGERGVWALRYNLGAIINRGRLEQYQGPRRSLDLGDFDLAYQSFDSNVTSTVTLPGPNWMILDLSRGGDRMLVAELARSNEESATSHLYIAGADGNNANLLYSHVGGFQSARFSPDGRYILLNTYASPSGTGRSVRPRSYEPYLGLNTYKPLLHYPRERQAVVLLSADGSMPPRILAEKLKREYTAEPFPAVGATFLNRDGGTKVLVAEWEANSGVVTLLDLARPQWPLSQREVAGAPAWPAWATETEDGQGLILAWQSGYNEWSDAGGANDANSMMVLHVSMGKTTRAQVSLGPAERLSDVGIKDGYLVYTTQQSMPRTREASSFTVRALSLSDLGKEPPSSGKAPDASTPDGSLHTAEMPRSVLFPYPLPWALGSTMLTYASQGRMHGRTYDGSVYLPLEEGITAIYSLHSYEAVDPLW